MAGQRRLRLHHVCTAFVALLCVAHVLVALLTIQHEEVWTTLTTGQVRTSALSNARAPRLAVKSDIRIFA